MMHTINKSPFSHSALEECAYCAAEGAPILLIEDGVYGAQAMGDVEPRMRVIVENHPVYALKEDLEARGITRLIDKIEVIDYAGFVDLAEKHQVVAWV